jgi:hypothetical protein
LGGKVNPEGRKMEESPANCVFTIMPQPTLAIRLEPARLGAIPIAKYEIDASEDIGVGEFLRVRQ